MSNTTRESGNIQLTKTGYQQLIRATRTAFNAYYAKAYAIAIDLYEELKAIKGLQAQTLRFNECYRRYSSFTGRHTLHLRKGVFTLDECVIDVIYRELFRGKGGSLTKPRKQEFTHFSNTMQEFTVYVADGASARFSKSPSGEGAIYWHVDEGNHSVRHAKDSGAFDVFMQVLAAYTFKRNEGGCWYFIDEYEIESAHDDGRAANSEISAAFGPLGIQERSRTIDARIDAAYLSRKKLRPATRK